MSPAASEGSAPARILVIDDDPRIRQIIRQVLEAEGFSVDAAEDGLRGLERALSASPSLIVLDMHLPVLGGAALVERLSALDGRCPPIVLITADDRPAEQARRVGAVAYLRKPFDLDDLIAMVRRGLSAGSG